MGEIGFPACRFPSGEKEPMPLLADGKVKPQWTRRRKEATGGAGQFEQERNHGKKAVQ
jgi:hypothetical protein